jgi:hypothetical protein
VKKYHLYKEFLQGAFAFIVSNEGEVHKGEEIAYNAIIAAPIHWS